MDTVSWNIINNGNYCGHNTYYDASVILTYYHDKISDDVKQLFLGVDNYISKDMATIIMDAVFAIETDEWDEWDELNECLEFLQDFYVDTTNAKLFCHI